MRRSALINIMVKAADKAGRQLLRDFGDVEHLTVSRKGPADFVSQADRRAETIIRDTLKEARPEFAFFGEEGGQTGPEEPEGRWICDPLDGTTNFLHGLPHWAISIALEQAGVIVAGLIFDPVKDELFWAERGHGAYLNSRPLRVTRREDLSASLFATGLPYKGRDNQDGMVASVERVSWASAGVRRAGSAALDLAYVAAGRYDGFWERGLSAWDVAAGGLIVNEAGGRVTDFEGGNRIVSDRSIIAAAPMIYDQLLQLVRPKSGA
ncbi:MAG: inositol monophosphatase [Alphaproteobacteria bacterium TMED89]|nr:MAG: inositol monophosphatase [Alphaproteobacteria bacterium TMED89]RZO30813.1 MAG: inositol monophosphatase [Rhodospirillaceae bacterium]